MFSISSAKQCVVGDSDKTARPVMRFQFQNMIYSLDQRAVFFGRWAWGKLPPAGSPAPWHPAHALVWVVSLGGPELQLAESRTPARLSSWVAPLGGVQAAGAGLAVSAFARSERKQTECFPHKSTHRSSGEKHRRTAESRPSSCKENTAEAPLGNGAEDAVGALPPAWRPRGGSLHSTV